MAPDGIGRMEAHVRTCTSCRERLSLAIAASPVSRQMTDHAGADGSTSRLAPNPTGAWSGLARGTAIGRYTVLEPLGSGGMGEVYAAYDPELDRKIALKILHAGGGADDTRARGRLLREAKAIAKLRHPNVVVVHDAGTVDERVFLAMEHVDGQTLAAWLAESPRTRQEILTVFRAAARGLGAAHAAGLVHRDFKPQNVMVGRDGEVRVMDFGLARSIDGEPEVVPDAAPAARRADAAAGAGEVVGAGAAEASGALASPALRLTRTGELVGTPLFMAPEQFQGQRTDARTDQFSFCETLYLALYGTHPFGGASLGELMAAVTDGRVQPPPAKSAVPQWLRRLVLRGLNVDPAARWPSMDALTAALSRDPARLRRRWLVGAAIAVAVFGGAWALRSPGRAESVCRSGSRRLVGVWEQSTGPEAARPRRDATRAAFVKTGRSHAVETWERTAHMLDTYTADWLRMYTDACEATHVHGEQSSEVLDLRMTCLGDRLERVRALTKVFAEASPAIVDKAVTAAGALPPLDRCADVGLLRAVVPPPDSPATRARVEALKRELARVDALGKSGQCPAALAAWRALVTEGEKLGYRALEGEIREPGAWASECMSNAEYRDTLQHAALAGLASHDEEVTARASMFLAQMLADRTSDVVQARNWIDIATATMQGMSRPEPVLESWRLQAESLVYAAEGATDKALDSIKRAEALMEKTRGSEHPDIPGVFNIIGLMLAHAGRFEEALGAYQRSVALTTKLNGPDHVLVAFAVSNEAEALNALHRHEEARVASERALEIRRRAGSNQFYEGQSLTSLGQALLGLGRSAEAVAPLERALALVGDDLSTYPPEIRFALARALWSSPDKRARSLALAQEAKARYQRLGHQAAKTAEVETWLRAHDDRGSDRRRARTP